ncbi:MAG TPA: pyridoxal-dependent decarboxylase, exosortase A system-associated [Sphingomicrobium sp.]|nr:pyridoxal-dependent decarboxylase, exosortase A system-associated [Sphingomicrobium sp.]
MKDNGPIPAGFVAGEQGRLLIGDYDVDALIAGAGGTPLFVYDAARIGQRIAEFRFAMPDGVALHYAVKANPYEPLLTFMARHVDGFDVASIGEFETLHSLDFEDLPMSFAGPGKRDSELERAIAAEVTINLESEGEAARVLTIAGTLGIRPKVAVRVNPPFALKGAGMKMGGGAAPFGIDHDRAANVAREMIAAGADWRGLHIYAGSQVLHAPALIEAHRATVALAATIADEIGEAPLEINLGGGFGIAYFPGEAPLDVMAVGAGLCETLENVPNVLALTRFSIELGRWLVGEAGVYLTRIVDRKQSNGRNFLVTDGGLHHMLAASGNFGQLLRRNYPVAIASQFGAPLTEEATIVGSLCTPLDLLADEIAVPHAEVGDLVAIFCAGAYGLSASPQAFLSQPSARETMINHDLDGVAE